jgi:hypothetical protein
MAEIEISGRKVVLERFTLVKAMRVITLLGLIQKSVPDITKAMTEFKREYRDSNVIELDRVQAKLQYGSPTPVLGDDGEVLYREGEIVTIPSPIDQMTEADWERSGHVLKLRQSPSTTEMLMAVFPVAYEQAEKPVQRLLALIAMPNDDVARYAETGELWDRVDDVAAKVIAPAYIEEVMELAVAAGEQVEGQVMTKARGLGDRVGNLLRLFGLRLPTETSDSTQSTSTMSSEPPVQPNTISVSPSPSSSDGSPETSSDSTGTPSSRSESNLTASVT